MAKYDDASWHYGGDFPKELVNENAATHIGMFITWCADHDLLSEFQLEDAGEAIGMVKNRTITGAEFLMDYCDEKFTDEDLDETGNAFTGAYYHEDTAFATTYAPYLEDYCLAFENRNLPSIYHLENTWENYNVLKPILNKRFAEWKAFVKK